MSYSYPLLKSIVSIFNYLLVKPGNVFVYSLLWFNFSTTEINAEDNILVIHSYDSEAAQSKEKQKAISQSFIELDNQNNVYQEFLAEKNYSEGEFVDYINQKYNSLGINLLMVVDDPSLDLVLEQRDRLLNKVPVVFLGVNNLRQEIFDTPWLTGVIENDTIKDTVLEATRQTWSDTIVIVNDTSQEGKANLEQIQEVQQIRDRSLKVEVINDLLTQDIENRLGRYPDHVPILLLGQLRQKNADQTLINQTQDVKILQSQIPNPMYTENSLRLGTGVVGGRIFDTDYHVKQAVGLAEQILKGVKPDEVGPISKGKNRWIFDYRQLQNYNIQLELLPDNSELLYMGTPLHVKYRSIILIVGLILFSSFLAIAFLIANNRRRGLANKVLQQNEQRYKDLAEAGANVFWELDQDLKYSYISGDVQDLCGLKPEQLIGYHPFSLHHANPQLDLDWELFTQITQARQAFKNFNFSLRSEEDKIRIFKINGNPLYDENRNFLGYRGVKQEITAEQNLYKKIAYQATYDDLTGLLNRREFNEKLKYSVKKAQKYQTESVLCYLDLDRFKIVNDTAGHLVGDRLLSELAQLLESMIRKEDTLGRLGGDEFGLLLEGCSLKEAEQICEQLIASINNYRLKWNNVEFDVGVSIGIVGIKNAALDAAEILSRADLACYQAKNLGRGRVYIVENNHQEVDLQQTQMSHIANVSQAIEENRFYLVKQLIKPILDDKQKREHYEILLRLQDRGGKLINPAQFIPVAERYGVITILDRWVLETTLNSYYKCFDRQQTLVSINLSGASINDERFTNFAINLIKKSQVPGNCLCFEITETAAIKQLDRAQEFIAAMKELGVKFALDDFGSGVSSFTYLKNLPVDYLKIDGSLIKNILSEKYDRAIVNSINEIAHLMGIKTIAEFVDSDEVLKHLGKISIDYAQGYFLGQPVAICSPSAA